MMEFSRQSLSTGWSFRDRDADEWMPVSVVPSVVQQDLIANKKLGASILSSLALCNSI